MDKLIEKIKSNGKTVYLLNDDEINGVADITKEVACGFAEWCWKSGWCRSSKWDGVVYWFNHSVSNQSIPSSELFDIYIKSL